MMFVTTHGLQGIGHDALTSALAFVALALASVPSAAAWFRRRIPIHGALLLLLGAARVLAAITSAASVLSGWHPPGRVTAGLTSAW